MKTKIKSKGERLKWKHISEVYDVKLTSEMTKGIKVDIKNIKMGNLIVK